MMLAERREFEHLRRQPCNPSVANILYRDGRTITEAKSELSAVAKSLLTRVRT